MMSLSLEQVEADMVELHERGWEVAQELAEWERWMPDPEFVSVEDAMDRERLMFERDVLFLTQQVLAELHRALSEPVPF